MSILLKGLSVSKGICIGKAILINKDGINYVPSFIKKSQTKSEVNKFAKSLSNIKKEYKIHLLTDVHTEFQCELVKDVVDIIQIPAFLCRQTDLLIAAAKTNKIININKVNF